MFEKSLIPQPIFHLLEGKSPDLLPTPATRGSVAYDLHLSRTRLTILPNAITVAPCGVRLEFPPNHYGLICPRSGLATKGLTIVNAPGVIDPDYRGELKVILTNLGTVPITLDYGQAIAQLLILSGIAIDPTLEIERTGGFGSTDNSGPGS